MTVFVDPEEEEILEHESFGMINIHRIDGDRALFGVDYNTGHAIRIEVQQGQLRRDSYRDWFFGDKIVAQIEMSEVQFARLISSPNTTGVPCTLKAACTEGFKQMEDPPEHMVDKAKLKSDVDGVARRVSANLDHIRSKLDDMANGKAPVTKGAVKELAGLMQQTQQGIESDMPYLTARMHERVDEQVHSAKAEVEAHIQFKLAELGTQALGEKIRGGGVAIRIGGRKADLKQLTKEKEDEPGPG